MTWVATLILMAVALPALLAGGYPPNPGRNWRLAVVRNGIYHNNAHAAPVHRECHVWCGQPGRAASHSAPAQRGMRTTGTDSPGKASDSRRQCSGDCGASNRPRSPLCFRSARERPAICATLSACSG